MAADPPELVAQILHGLRQGDFKSVFKLLALRLLRYT